MSRFRLYGLGAAILFIVSASAWLWLHNQGKDHVRGDGEAKESPHALAKMEKAGAEEGGQYTPSMRERERGVREKEEALKKHQERLELLKKDLRSERVALDELRKQVQDELHQVSKKIVVAIPQPSDLDSRRAALRDEALIGKSLLDTEAARNNLVKEVAYYESMPAEKTAAILQQMYANEPDKVVKLLSQMKAAAAMEVLAEVSTANSDLSAQLDTRIRKAPPVTAPFSPAPTFR